MRVAPEYRSRSGPSSRSAGSIFASVEDFARIFLMRLNAVASGSKLGVGLTAATAVRPSTREWFATARNYALYSNQGGIYDDILKYLKIG